MALTAMCSVKRTGSLLLSCRRADTHCSSFSQSLAWTMVSSAIIWWANSWRSFAVSCSFCSMER